jgi:hypothetical protein
MSKLKYPHQVALNILRVGATKFRRLHVFCFWEAEL